MASSRIRRILFFAESVTLAHVARPLTLALGLDRERFEPIFACHPRCARFTEPLVCEQATLDTIDSQRFLDALARGSPVYDIRTLRRYLDEDLTLIERTRPDLIVGDFRLSLSVSARLAGIPYATLTNAYWSPFTQNQRMPLPALPMTRVLPLPAARCLFNLAQPLALALHCRPINQLRSENGLRSLGADLRRVYTDADITLYADVPSLLPLTPAVSDSHHFIGPVMWSPSGSLPRWWDEVDTTRPVVYVTLGSSGQRRLFHLVVDALATLPVTVIASTAGAPSAERPAANAFAAAYLPGDVAAGRSSLVLCNGGSPTSHQAIAAGAPVVGIASNMDQFMNMAALVDANAGQLIRADRVSKRSVRDAVARGLDDTVAKDAAVRLQSLFAQYNAVDRFQDVVATVLADERWHGMGSGTAERKNEQPPLVKMVRNTSRPHS